MVEYSAFIDFGTKNFIFKLNYYKNNHVNTLIIIKIIKQYIAKAIAKVE